MSMQVNDLKEARLEKLRKIRELGWNPYAPSYDKTHTIKDALESEGKVVKTAGRLMSFREHGNIAFADLKDETGRIQIFFQKKLLGESFKNIRLLDIGDFIGVEGEVGNTIAGEISILPSSYTLLSKATLPLPSEWFGIKDIEKRYRQRYLDLILNDESRQIFNIRTKVVSGTREYLDSLSFWEVETPTLQLQYGGANAKPFKTHLNALGQDVYLRIADELFLKRLIVGGYERVYEICKDFRNEGIDQTHFPEFTMIEWYEAYADYHRVMDVAEGLIKHLAQKIYGSTTMKVGEHQIDVGNKWPRIEMSVIMKEKLGIDVESETAESLLQYAKSNFPGMQLLGGETKGQLIFEIFDHAIPKLLIEPTFIIDYPEEISPLAKSHRSKPGWVERFEGYIGGKEIFDGWSELTDPVVQRERFTNDSQAVRKDKEEAQKVDEDFIEAMEYGMPPVGGIGIGIDRLTMFFTNKWGIKEVVLFPTLKAENTSESNGTDSEKPNPVTPLGKPDIFSIHQSIKEFNPTISVGTAIIQGVTIQKSSEALEQEKKEMLQKLQGLTTEQIGEMDEIKSYRKLYKEMGVDWHSRRPSPEALLRRIAQGKDLYTINTVVDAYNLVVMRHRISVGAFDLDRLSLPSVLRLANEGEQILLLGDESPTAYKKGEVAYFDQEGGYNMDFNYRDAQRTAVQLETKNLIINVDGVYSIAPKRVEEVLRETVDMIIKYNGGTVTEFGVETS